MSGFTVKVNVKRFVFELLTTPKLYHARIFLNRDRIQNALNQLNQNKLCFLKL